MQNFFKLVVITFLLTACGASKVVNESRKAIKGTWTLSSINYNQDGTFKVDLLDDASAVCFEGSTWNFISNNNSGTYTINQANCVGGDRYFNFTIQEVDPQTGLYDFLLKPTNVKGKSETNNSGYRIKLNALGESTMQWQQTVTLDGRPFIISMNFNKNL